MSKFVEMLGGLRMPFPGFGTASFPSTEILEQSVESALQAGYRHFDTAYIYTNSEETIGKVFKRWISSGKLKREDLFVVTKLPREGVDPSKVDHYMKESLERLQLDYVDLYLIHHPILSAPSTMAESGRIVPGDPLPTDIIGTWKKMEDQVDAGRTKSIGLSNFDQRQIERIWQAARIKPSCLQIKISMFLQRANIVKFCQDKGMVVVGYSMLNPPRQETTGISTNVFTNDIISGLAKKYGKSNGQIVLRFFVQKNVVGIPKSTNPERIKANITLFDFSLDSDDVKILEGVHVGKAAIGRTMGDMNPKLKNHPEYPVFDD